MNVELTKACGDCLCALRKSVGLTQVELAGKLCVPQSFVSKIETGERALKVYEVFSYANALGVPVDVVMVKLEEAVLVHQDQSIPTTQPARLANKSLVKSSNRRKASSGSCRKKKTV